MIVSRQRRLPSAVAPAADADEPDAESGHLAELENLFFPPLPRKAASAASASRGRSNRFVHSSVTSGPSASLPHLANIASERPHAHW